MDNKRLQVQGTTSCTVQNQILHHVFSYQNPVTRVCSLLQPLEHFSSILVLSNNTLQCFYGWFSNWQKRQINLNWQLATILVSRLVRRSVCRQRTKIGLEKNNSSNSNTSIQKCISGNSEQLWFLTDLSRFWFLSSFLTFLHWKSMPLLSSFRSATDQELMFYLEIMLSKSGWRQYYASFNRTSTTHSRNYHHRIGCHAS